MFSNQHRFIFLNTVADNGAPWANPVWFVPTGTGGVVVYADPESKKVSNLRADPRAQVFTGADVSGHGWQAVSVHATLIDAPGAVELEPGYVDKYAMEIHRFCEQLGIHRDDFGQRFSTCIHLTPHGKLVTR